MQQVEGAHFTTVGCPDSIECVATLKNFDWDDKATERRKCISFLLVFVFAVSICLDKLCTLNLPNSELLHTALFENKMTKHFFFVSPSHSHESFRLSKPKASIRKEALW